MPVRVWHNPGNTVNAGRANRCVPEVHFLGAFRVSVFALVSAGAIHLDCDGRGATGCAIAGGRATDARSPNRMTLEKLG